MDAIRLRGATIHNLQAVDLDFPIGALTVVTGVSGSGKSSLVFDTLHAEGQRRYLQALSLGGGVLRRPPVDLLEGLPPTVALRQHERRPGADLRLSEVTELGELLAVLFARMGIQHDPVTGEAIRPVSHDQIIADLLHAEDDARLLIEAPVLPSPGASMAGLLDEVARAGFSRVRHGGRVVRVDEMGGDPAFDPDLRIVVDRMKRRAGVRPRLAEALRTAGTAGRGVIVAVLPNQERTFVDRPFSLSSGRTFPALTPSLFSRRGRGGCPICGGAGIIDGEACAACGGVGLDEAARFVRLGDRSWGELAGLPLAELAGWLDVLAVPVGVDAMVADMVDRLRSLVTLRLGHLSLGRLAATLSGGEWQRVRLGRLVGAPLAGVLYVMDEPTAGLAEDVVPAVIEVIEGVVERGNTVIAVSHREALVRRAHRVVELGPGAGEAGGKLLYSGPVESLGPGSPTGDWLAGRLHPAASTQAGGAGVLPLSIPQWPASVDGLALQHLTAVTGPAGSGRSSLLRAVAGVVRGSQADQASSLGIERVLEVDRRRTGSKRSTVATFVGVWNVVRELLAATTEARIRGLTPTAFSLAVGGGRCEACKGQGETKVDLGALPPVWLVCEVCDGRRFQQDVLGVRWKGHSAADLLALPASVAHPLLAGHPRLDRTLRSLVDVGLGYVSLGQSTASLSGGEAARLRLARELGRSVRGIADALIVVDEPTAGLHPVDARATVELLLRLVEAGGTLLVSAGDPQLLAVAHRVVRLG